MIATSNWGGHPTAASAEEQRIARSSWAHRTALTTALRRRSACRMSPEPPTTELGSSPCQRRRKRGRRPPVAPWPPPRSPRTSPSRAITDPSRANQLGSPVEQTSAESARPDEVGRRFRCRARRIQATAHPGQRELVLLAPAHTPTARPTTKEGAGSSTARPSGRAECALRPVSWVAPKSARAAAAAITNPARSRLCVEAKATLSISRRICLRRPLSVMSPDPTILSPVESSGTGASCGSGESDDQIADSGVEGPQALANSLQDCGSEPEARSREAGGTVRASSTGDDKGFRRGRSGPRTTVQQGDLAKEVASSDRIDRSATPFDPNGSTHDDEEVALCRPSWSRPCRPECRPRRQFDRSPRASLRPIRRNSGTRSNSSSFRVHRAPPLERRAAATFDLIPRSRA